MRRILAAVAALILLFNLGACQPRSERKEPSRLVYVSIPPLQPFCQELLGKDVSCRSLMPPGTNPHQFEPTPRQAREVLRSDLFITAGMEFEDQIASRLKAAGIPVLDLQNEEPEGHAEHAEHHHEPHIWLSPLRMEECCTMMAGKLCLVYPARAGEIMARLEGQKKRLGELDLELREKFMGKRRAFLVYHPAWTAFAECYGLREIAVEKDGHEPAPRFLHSVLEEVKKLCLRRIFVQKGNSERLALNIAREAGLEIIYHDALSTNYFEEIRGLASDILGEER